MESAVAVLGENDVVGNVNDDVNRIAVGPVEDNEVAKRGLLHFGIVLLQFLAADVKIIEAVVRQVVEKIERGPVAVRPARLTELVGGTGKV